MTLSQAKQLIQQLRADGINEEGIRTRLISEGLSEKEIRYLLTEPIELTQRKPRDIQPSKLLSIWLEMHTTVVLLSMIILLIMYVLGRQLDINILTALAIPLFIDAGLQLWCYHKLLTSRKGAYYNLVGLFVIRILIILVVFDISTTWSLIVLNVIDLFCLLVGMQTSKVVNPYKKVN